MKAYLLDVNVLLALAWNNHPQHGAAERWFESTRRRGWATCALTEIGFIRLSANPSFTSHPQPPPAALALLGRLRALPKHSFWQDPSGGTQNELVADVFRHVLVHGFVTDGYLVAVARSNGGRLATFDKALHRLFPHDTDLLSSA